MTKIDFKCFWPKWPSVQEIDKVDDRNEILKGCKHFYQREIIKNDPWVQKFYETELWTVCYDSSKTEH